MLPLKPCKEVLMVASSSHRIGRRLLMLALALVAARAGATEPLQDSIEIGGEAAVFLAPKCCWIPMPRSEQLRQARGAERCSAIGGPVGAFRLEGDAVLLVGFRRCSGDVPLAEIYPDLPDPAPADWLDGVFSALLMQPCRGGGADAEPKRIQLTLEAGRVTRREEIPAAPARCPPW